MRACATVGSEVEESQVDRRSAQQIMSVEQILHRHVGVIGRYLLVDRGQDIGPQLLLTAATVWHGPAWVAACRAILRAVCSMSLSTFFQETAENLKSFAIIAARSRLSRSALCECRAPSTLHRHNELQSARWTRACRSRDCGASCGAVTVGFTLRAAA